MEMYELFSDELKLSEGKSQCEEVSPPNLFSFPHNCIGSLSAVNKKGVKINFGTGFLVSNRLVLTSAHAFKTEMDELIVPLKPSSFSIQ